MFSSPVNKASTLSFSICSSDFSVFSNLRFEIETSYVPTSSSLNEPKATTIFTLSLFAANVCSICPTVVSYSFSTYSPPESVWTKIFLAGVELTSNDTLYACPASTVTSLTMACPCHLLSPPHERSVSKPLYSTPRTSSVEVFLIVAFFNPSVNSDHSKASAAFAVCGWTVIPAITIAIALTIATSFLKLLLILKSPFPF